MARTHQVPPRVKRSPSPAHRPRTATDDNVYVLTLSTDERLHEHMTSLRSQYFPRRLNKLAAHLTLFHALPESKLESRVLTLLEGVASKTSRFVVKADRPFRLGKGFAVSVSSHAGGHQVKEIHRLLRNEWADFLSDQDAGPCRLHYTLMNKVDDEAEVSRAYDRFTGQWTAQTGTAEGLTLWMYDRGHWEWQRTFSFGGEGALGITHQPHSAS